MKRFSILFEDKNKNIKDNAERVSGYNFRNVISDLNLQDISRFTDMGSEEINYVLDIMINFETTIEDIKIRHEVTNDFLNTHGFFDVLSKHMSIFGEIKEKHIQAKRNMMRVHADLTSDGVPFLNYNRITSSCAFYDLTYKAINALYKDFGYLDIKSPHLKKFAQFIFDLIDNEAFKKLDDECNIFVEKLNEGVVFDIEMNLNSILRITSLEMFDFRYIKPVQTGIFYSVMKALSIEEKNKRNKFTYIEKEYTQTSKVSPADDMYLKTVLENQINMASRRLAAIYESLIDLFMDISGELIFYKYALKMIGYMRKIQIMYCFPEIKKAAKGEKQHAEFYDLCDIVLSAALENPNLAVIRNNYIMDENDDVTIIVGANQSGKTTFIRAFGSSLMFARSGLPVPASRAEVTYFSNMFTHFQRYDADIKNEGQLDTELEEMEKIVYSTKGDSIILMNESFSSTGIRDALNIASDIVPMFSHIGAKVMFVTHIPELFERIRSDDKILNKAAIRLYCTGMDKENKPTYKLERVY